MNRRETMEAILEAVRARYDADRATMRRASSAWPQWESFLEGVEDLASAFVDGAHEAFLERIKHGAAYGEAPACE